MTNESRSNGSHNNYNNDGVVILDPDLHCSTDDGCCNVEESEKSAFETSKSRRRMQLLQAHFTSRSIPVWKHNLKDMAAICCAEFVGTAILLYGGCLCTVQLGGDNSLAGPLGFGFTVSVVICIFGPISAAHINPAVTLCAALYGSIEYKVGKGGVNGRVIYSRQCAAAAHCHIKCRLQNHGLHTLRQLNN